MKDVEIIKKVAVCLALLVEIERSANKQKKQHQYLTRLLFVGQQRLNKVISKQIVTDVSKWLSSFEDSERKKHEAMIALDITALLDHILARSLFYNGLIIKYTERNFSKIPSYNSAMSVINSRKRERGLYEDELATWIKRVEAAKSVPSELAGYNFLIKTSEFNRDNNSKLLEAYDDQLRTFANELESLMSIVRN